MSNNESQNTKSNKNLRDHFTNVIRSPVLSNLTSSSTSSSTQKQHQPLGNDVTSGKTFMAGSISSPRSAANTSEAKVVPRENNNRIVQSRGMSSNINMNATKMNRHTIAEPYLDSNANITFQNYKTQQQQQQNFYNTSDSNSSPISKTPDSNSNENWLTLNDQPKRKGINIGVVGDISSGVGTGSIGTLGDSDHDLFESSATGFSSSNGGLEGESADEADLDSYSHNLSSSAGTNRNEDTDDYTTKRLKTFLATTLHNELIYLDKLSKLINFKTYLEENYAGSLADINVLFSGIPQIYTVHDIVASKLQEYSNSLSDLIHQSYNSKHQQQHQQQQQAINTASASTFSSTSTTSSSTSSSSNSLMKEQFLSNALQLLANIMEISFPVYLEFLKNYPKSMTILNKLENPSSNLVLNNKTSYINPNSNKIKSFPECQYEFNKHLQQKETNLSKYENNNNIKDKKVNLSRTTTTKSSSPPTTLSDPYSIYYNDLKRVHEEFDLTKIFAEEILRRPTKLFEFIYSLKEECILASKEITNNYSNHLQANIKSLFDNESSKSLREKVFDEINRNIMPKEVRKNEDVVELIESSNEKRIRHLILYGDCLVCCKTKKEKRHLKWLIPIDQLEIRLDEYKSDKTETDLRHLRQLKEEVVSLRKRQTEDASARNQQKIKKKLAEQENELTIQNSRLKLIVRLNPSLASNPQLPSTSNSSATTQLSSTTPSQAALLYPSHHHHHNFPSPLAAISISMTNLSPNKSHLANNTYYNNINHSNSSSNQSSITNSIQNMNNSNLNTSYNSNNQYIILFTSDYERIAWLEEINGAIYAFKARKTTVNIQLSDIEARINSLKKVEEPPKAVTSSCTGSLELHIKHIEEISQPNKLFVAVELKSCGSYLQVAQTECSELTNSPKWDEKFNLELQCVDSLRIVLYCQTSDKALAISSQELKIDSNVNLNKINCVKLDNSITIHLAMKFLSPKKTITRRKTRNRNDIFGGNLSDLLQREKSTIPRILKDCVEVIEGKGIDEVGIYRVSSVVSEVQKMKDLYSKNPNQAHSELRQKSPHLSANVLKLYLRELPDPLFTSYLYHRFMSALDCSIPEFRMSELCRIFNDLPDPNKTIILFILTHLLNIASHSDKNMMGLQNLCTLFGPTLMKLSPKDNLQVDDMAKEIKESMQQAQVLFYILQLHSDDRLISDPSAATTSSIQKQQTDNKYADNNFMKLVNLNKLQLNAAASTGIVAYTGSAANASSVSAQQTNKSDFDKNNNLTTKPTGGSLNDQSKQPQQKANNSIFNKSNMQTTL